jgi:type IV pilus biogenesis protein PilP
MAASGAHAADEVAAPSVDHVRTIDDLLNAESRALEAKSRPPTGGPRVVVPTSTTPTEVLDVTSIWGYTDSKHAVISLDGQRSTVSVGDHVGRFRVASITGGCVTLQALKASGKAVPAKKGSASPFGAPAAVERLHSCFQDPGLAGAGARLVIDTEAHARANPLPTTPPIVPASTLPVNSTAPVSHPSPPGMVQFPH